ncbi:hypothetical protein SCOR_20845 [Sulfidibacter corallicola]|uniref:Uncharacterized protein n=1 Tax=Sulfidibacter corallicola TaxID=2818388 RepID=A0A8A4TUF8_SULCO|nr:hypothetical protein [Sulfidibacter corallicola]QTD53113.1 hypothetical protein J3U87_11685 [Sulfidibacter corallicola]
MWVMTTRTPNLELPDMTVPDSGRNAEHAPSKRNAPVSDERDRATPPADDQGRGFLRWFYRLMLLSGILGLMPCALFASASGLPSFAFGVLFVLLMVGLWDFTLFLSLNPQRPSPSLGSMLIFLHYGLLGGAFYAMISMFDVSWEWFSVGTSLLIPSLLLALFFSSRGATTKR